MNVIQRNRSKCARGSRDYVCPRYQNPRWTVIPMIRPCVSTMIWRFLPQTFFTCIIHAVEYGNQVYCLSCFEMMKSGKSFDRLQ
ncbi:uncharacterized protein Dvar_15090 [Desulfosarcina variabilis str. Montpellier]